MADNNENVIANILRKKAQAPAPRPAVTRQVTGASPRTTSPAPRATEPEAAERVPEEAAPSRKPGARLDVCAMLDPETYERLERIRTDRRIELRPGREQSSGSVVADGLEALRESTRGEFPLSAVDGPTGTRRVHLRLDPETYREIAEIQNRCGGRPALSMSAIIAACIENA